ncbi:MAG TPA: EAL domain-containing protein, partial [Candidatus Dormibacteraeota bacterium]|nr:EAL domain-containing protein [Candidatus Dormibacteraeota bacterium]
LPVGEIKIDRAFVTSLTRDRSDQAIVRTILELARNLAIPVVAEGVEDLATSDMLKGMGCPAGQGYLFAKPMASADMLAWLDERQPRQRGVIVQMSPARDASLASSA